nr:TPA_asm: FtsK [Larimichthys croaker adintovirus]
MSHLTNVEQVHFDPRLAAPFSCMIVGPSGCGKTYFVKSVIENCEHVINGVPDNIVWIYTSFQPMYAELQKMNKKIKFVEGLPDSFDDTELFPPDQNHLIILDDVIFQASDHPEVVKIFTQYRHHRNMSVFMLTQNVFHRGKHSRTMSLNSNYLVLFKNPRDKLQMNILAHQIFPSQKAFFLESFEDATKDPRGYLLVDLTPSCPEPYRLRTGILPPQWPVVYVPRTK